MDDHYITEIKNISDAQNYISTILKRYQPEDVLCLFDIDQTLLKPCHPACQKKNIEKYKDVLFNLKLKYSCFYPTIQGNFMLIGEHEIIDENIFSLLNFLETSQIKTLAFTANTNIRINGKDLREERFQQLQRNGICFEKNFPEKEVIFDELNLFRGHPCIYRGIIFSNGTSVCANKGVVLNSFLKRLHKQPRCIILLDDNLKNHADITYSLMSQRRDIDFYPMFYTGALQLPVPEISEKEFADLWEEYLYNESLLCEKIERKNFIC